MKNRTRMLKVKIKSLAAEAVIIRREEQPSKGEERSQLCEHRRGIVRYEARHSQIAYGYLRGLRYDQVERGCPKPFNADKVRSMVERFGAWKDDDELYADFEIRKNAERKGFADWFPKPVKV